MCVISETKIIVNEMHLGSFQVHHQCRFFEIEYVSSEVGSRCQKSIKRYGVDLLCGDVGELPVPANTMTSRYTQSHLRRVQSSDTEKQGRCVGLSKSKNPFEIHS